MHKELISPYLKQNICDLERRYGRNSPEYLSLTRQYYVSEEENNVLQDERERHYDADVKITYNNKCLSGVERLYKRTLVIEITSICASHCRWCLRANYKKTILNNLELSEIARYCGSPENKDVLNEVLITGGDPLMVPDKLNALIDNIIEFAPNIRTIRVGTRTPVQDPRRINRSLIKIFQKRGNILFEIGTHINSFVELSSDARQAISLLVDHGMKVYCQSVLLKGINDNEDYLISLYDSLRQLGVEIHYLFHCVPIRGMRHFRTSVEKGLHLIKKITSSGYFSGRAKPVFALMTDIGKIIPYEGTIIEKRNGLLLLRSEYSVQERLLWNKYWTIPDSVHVREDGKMNVWYLDGEDE